MRKIIFLLKRTNIFTEWDTIKLNNRDNRGIGKEKKERKRELNFQRVARRCDSVGAK